MGANQNPMMNIGDTQMPINQINPQDLMGNPQALYAYHQMMAALQGGGQANPQILSPDVMARNSNMMQQYFPQMRRF